MTFEMVDASSLVVSIICGVGEDSTRFAKDGALRNLVYSTLEFGVGLLTMGNRRIQVSVFTRWLPASLSDCLSVFIGSW